MQTLPPTYDSSSVESKWYPFWEKLGLFNPDRLKARKERFSMVIPPPNVTGSLHLGHALNNTLQDIVVRWKRMLGCDVLWLPGTDHAGIATQNVVEKELAQENLTRHDLGREKFVGRVWEWKEKYGNRIVEQLKRIGVSCDWSRLRFTMDEGLSTAVRENFVRLYEEGLIYKGTYLINWCPRCQTALSDLEVEHSDTKGSLWHLRYPLADQKGKSIVVATTRPETMLGDTAVAVHPEDKRYKKLIGKEVILPLMNRRIPIIADDYVDPEFGSGAVKITPAHDFNDFEMARRHQLEAISVLDEKGDMNSKAGKFAGLSREECRHQVLAQLQEEGLIEKIEDYTYSIGHCQRCHTRVEPFLSEQWFMRMGELAKPAIEAVLSGKIKFIPSSWEKTYFEWMYNIKDWCISRQIWWGHQIPAWHCEACGALLVERKEPVTCRKCGSVKLKRETDVLDTWFSSALWPFSTLGWPDKEAPDLKRFYPTDLLITAFDIIFFWVARMIMIGLHQMKEVPFREVYITPLVRDVYGQKMSKSKGNVIDPLQVADRHGMDALRFTLAALSTPGRDIKLSEQRIEGYRNFLNKIWNASRFVLMNMENNLSPESMKRPSHLSVTDCWILSRLHRVTESVNDSLAKYRFDEAVSALYQFAWHEFCDWYVEMSKVPLSSGENSDERKGAQWTLLKTLETLLRLLHPFIPYLTEELWHSLPGSRAEESIAILPYPTEEELCEWKNPAIEKEVDAVRDCMTAIRTMRTENAIAPSQKIPVTFFSFQKESLDLLGQFEPIIAFVCRAEKITFTTQRPDFKIAAVTPAGGIDVIIPLAEIIDLSAEQQRLERDLKKIEKELELIRQRLTNENFSRSAPEDVVHETKEREKELLDKKKKLASLLEQIRSAVQKSS